MPKPSLKMIIFLAIVVLGTLLVIFGTERRAYREWATDKTFVAPNKNYTAAITFLEKSGHKAAMLDNWAAFKPKKEDREQLLVVLQQDLRTREAQEKLLGWVDQGNHLVISMEGLLGSQNPLDILLGEDQEQSQDDILEKLKGKEPSPMPLTTRIGLVYAKTESNSQTEFLLKKIMDKEDIRGDESADIKKMIEKLKKQSSTPKVNIDKKVLSLVCEQSSKKRQEALALFIKENPTINKFSEAGGKGATSNFFKTLMGDVSKGCVEDLTSLPLSPTKNIHLLFDSAPVSYPITYLGEESPMLEGRNSHGTQVIRLPHGKGSITVIPKSASPFLFDPETPMTDENTIRQFDHAYFLAYLSQEKSQVFLMHRAVDYMEEPPKLSLLKMLYTKTPEFLATLIIFILFFVWLHMYRHGPVLAQVDVARRNLNEHFHAQGEFLRRQIETPVLIQQLQEEIWRKVEKRAPYIRKQALDLQKKELARLTRMKESEFSALLIPINVERINTSELLRLVAALQTIRNKL